MNAPVRQLDAELKRRRFTVADCERMAEAGILDRKDRIELIDGELIELSPKGIRHEVIKNDLAEHWHMAGRLRYGIAVETTLRVTPETFFEPDIIVFDRSIGLPGLNGANALLLVEIADSSLAYDLDIKPGLYAAHGVREYWVIDAARRSIRLHRDPQDGRYTTILTAAADEVATPLLAPELSLQLDDLGRRP